jgi:hypothetical protein
MVNPYFSISNVKADQDRAAAAQDDVSASSYMQSSTPISWVDQVDSNRALNIKTPKMPGTMKHKKSKSTQNLKSRAVQDKIKMIR